AVFDDIAGDGGIGFDGNARWYAFGFIGREGHEIADDIAAADAQRAANVEIDDGNAGRTAIDDIVGDDRARKAELGIDRRLAGIAAEIAGDYAIAGGVEADGGEGTVLDVVIGDDNFVCEIDIDPIAVLPRAAIAPGDVGDVVFGDNG